MLSYTFTTVAGMICITIITLYLLLRPKHKRSRVEEAPVYPEWIANACTFNVKLDNCKFKDSSFVSEVQEDNSD